MNKLNEKPAAEPASNLKNDYIAITAYLLGTLKFAVVYNQPLSVEEMIATIKTATEDFKLESEVSNGKR